MQFSYFIITMIVCLLLVAKYLRIITILCQNLHSTYNTPLVFRPTSIPWNVFTIILYIFFLWPFVFHYIYSLKNNQNHFTCPFLWLNFAYWALPMIGIITNSKCKLGESHSWLCIFQGTGLPSNTKLSIRQCVKYIRAYPFLPQYILNYYVQTTVLPLWSLPKPPSPPENLFSYTWFLQPYFLSIFLLCSLLYIFLLLDWM